MKKVLYLLLLLALLMTTIYSQSRSEGSPTPVTGTTIRATLIDNATDGYQIYYYSMNLAAGAYRATIRSRTRECNGANVSVYIDGTANVFTSACDIPTNTSTGEYDFDLETSGNHVIAIYVTGGDNERFEVDLVFSGLSGPAVVGDGKNTGVIITPPGGNPRPAPSPTSVIPADGNSSSAGGPVVTGGTGQAGNGENNGITVTAPDADTTSTRVIPVKPSTGSKDKPPVGNSCVFESEFSVSNSNLRFFKQHGGIVFKRGTARLIVTTVNDEGSTLFGAVQVEQGGSRSNRNIFPLGSFGGRLRTPMSKQLIKEQTISGEGSGMVTIFFTQNRTRTTKTGRYKVVVTGDAVAGCNASTGREAFPA